MISFKDANGDWIVPREILVIIGLLSVAAFGMAISSLSQDKSSTVISSPVTPATQIPGSASRTFLLFDIINVKKPEFPVTRVEIINNGSYVLRINESETQVIDVNISSILDSKFNTGVINPGETTTLVNNGGIGTIYIVIVGDVANWIENNTVTLRTTRSNGAQSTSTLTEANVREKKYISLMFVDVGIDVSAMSIQ